MAAGAAAAPLCASSDEPIPAAETKLPRNLCPLIKASYGFALTDTCPYFYFSDFIVGETTCDGKRKMFELMNELKETYAAAALQRRRSAPFLDRGSNPSKRKTGRFLPYHHYGRRHS